MQQDTLRERRDYIDRAAALPTYNTSPPQPERTHQDFDPLYEESSFENRFHWYPNIQSLPDSEKAVVTSYEFSKGPNNGWGRNFGDRPQFNSNRVERVYFWIVKSWEGVNSGSTIQARYNHFLKVKIGNSYLKGSRYSNRFVRGTKVVITKGEYSGKHGVVGVLTF